MFPHKNIPLMYVYSAFFKRITIPILTLYYLLNNLSYTQIGIITSAAFATALLTEVYGGIFADRKGKKLSMNIAAALAVLTALLLLGGSFWWFFAAAIVWGLAVSFVSGTQSSLLYDTLEATSQTHKYRKYQGGRTLWSYLPNGIFLLFIPMLYQMDVRLPFIISAVFTTVSLITSFFVEDFESDTEDQSKTHERTDVRSNLKSIIIFGAIALSAQWLVADYFQPLKVAAGIPITIFGFIYASSRAITGWSASITHRFKATTAHWILAIGTIIAVLLMGIQSVVTVLAGLAVLKFVHGFNRVHVEEMISAHSNPQERTTTLSKYHLSKNIIIMVVAPVLGVLADTYGIHNMIFIFTPVLATALIWSASRVQVNLL